VTNAPDNAQDAADQNVADLNAADLALALELADIADAITLPAYLGRGFTVRLKDDRTEVTEADRGTEHALRERLTEVRPTHAVLGEEEGLIGASDASCRWIIDPIDGTSNFVKGVPIWATLVALERDGELVVGVASAPALGRRWWAVRGGGAHANGTRIAVSPVSALGDAHLAYSDIGSFARHGLADELVALTSRAWRARGIGDFWMHVLVAEGAFDAALEPIVSLWDLAAVQIIVEEAGGVFTNLQGEARADGGSAVSSNGHLHDTILQAFAH
jgi:histidinol-phosphatase